MTTTELNFASTGRKKFSLFKITFFGFNFIVGYAFVVGMSSSFGYTGNLFLMMLLVCAFIAFTVGLCFGRLSTIFPQYGGAYIYVKEAFRNRMLSWLIGWLQYIVNPLVAIAAIAGIVWAFQGITINNSSIFANDEMVLFAITIVVYLFLLLIVNFGFTSTMWAANILWFFKWIVLIGVIGLSLSQITHFTQNIFHHGYQPAYNSIGFVGFVFAIITFFFSFGGFEGIVAITEDVENPQKNMKKAILMIIISSTVFYVVYHLLFLGALGAYGKTGLLPQNLPTPTGNILVNPEATSDSPNPINNLIYLVFPSSMVAGIFIIPAVFSQVCNKLTTPVQNGWVDARLIACLARDGLLPYQFAKRNKNHQFQWALLLDTIISMGIVAIYLIIISINRNYQTKLDTTLEIYTLVAFTEYIIVIVAYFALYRQNKQLKAITNTFDLGLFGFTVGVLVFLLASYFYGSIATDVYNIQHGLPLQYVMQLGGFFGAIIISVFVWFIGKWCRWEAKAQHAVLHNIIEYPGVNTGKQGSLETDFNFEKQQIQTQYNYEAVMQINEYTKQLNLANDLTPPVTPIVSQTNLSQPTPPITKKPKNIPPKSKKNLKAKPK